LTKQKQRNRLRIVATERSWDERAHLVIDL